jgi:hypothetical protein
VRIPLLSSLMWLLDSNLIGIEWHVWRRRHHKQRAVYIILKTQSKKLEWRKQIHGTNAQNRLFFCPLSPTTCEHILVADM